MLGLPSFFESPHALTKTDVNESILVGLSGGKDSVALLHILNTYAKSVGCKLYAAHVNHGIRTDAYGNEALRDESFCRELCCRLGIPLFIKKLDIPALSKETKTSLEGCARDERYKFFSCVMKENGIKLLALAHNANDNLETQIFNLCRGSSVVGIEGIKKVRKMDGELLVVRPILMAGEDEIIEYCKSNSLEFMIDSTNFELDAMRNKIRHKIIPELEALFPKATRSSGRLSALASEQNDFILSEANKLLDKHLVIESGVYKLPLCEISKLHIALVRTLICEVYKKLQISLEFSHIEAGVELIFKGVPHSLIDLPRGAVLKIEDGYMLSYIGKEEKEQDFFDIPLNEGLNEINDSFAIYICRDDKVFVDSVYTLYTYAHVKCDTIKNMHARRRISGDKILDGGNRKSLKKLLCDKKVPLSLRDSLPIVCLGDEIIYIPLCAVSDSVKTDEKNSYVKICIYKKGK